MMATEPTTPPGAATQQESAATTKPAYAPTPTDPALAQARWRLLRNGVVGATLAAAVVLAMVVFLVARPDWWRGYAAATVCTVLAAGASLVPLWVGVRGTAPQLVQMFMIATASRAAVAVGLSALAVGVGHYPTIPTFALLLPYYLALLAAETSCLARGLKLRA
jgi:hypothetical protein